MDNNSANNNNLLTDTNLLNKRMDILEQKIDNLTNLVETLTMKIDTELTSECKKMGEHIDFVENVYEKVKYPLSYVCNRINGNSANNNLLTDSNEST